MNEFQAGLISGAGLALVFGGLLISAAVMDYGEQFGKDRRARYHCESLGYPEFKVSDRGTITCIKVTREDVK